MDLKYHDNGKWISLKAVCGEKDVTDTAADNDSTFATPKYITNKLITKDETGFVKYLDDTVLNKQTILSGSKNARFVSSIDFTEGETSNTFTVGYTNIELISDEKGEFVSEVGINGDGEIVVSKKDLSQDILNPISSGSTPPGEKTSGFFYLQVESSNNGSPV